MVEEKLTGQPAEAGPFFVVAGQTGSTAENAERAENCVRNIASLVGLAIDGIGDFSLRSKGHGAVEV